MNKKRIQQIKCLFTLFFVVCASFYATRSYAQNNAVTIRLSGVSMERVMNEIENQTNYLFLSNKDVDINSVVSVDVEARPLSEALAQMVRGTDVVYRFDGKYILLSKADRRPVTVKGVVTDADGAPVIGASVIVKGTTVGASTNTDGSFSLQVPPPAENAVLTVTYLGYEPVDVTVGSRTDFRITLRDSAVAVENVVVTALGIKRQEKALSYNVQQVKSEELTTVKDANFMNSLVGKVAGVQINSGASGPGASARVVMRGEKSIEKGNNVLYVIDGIPMYNHSFGGDGGTYDIGFQSLSGAMERGHDMVYVCYDNEAYMNTGIQRSSSTPHFADTTTTPQGTVIPGKMQQKKNLTKIMVAHGIPYVAQTTFIGNFKDITEKAHKAIYTPGAAFLNVMAPCPRGWRYPSEKLMEVTKMAVETCVWPLYEVVEGKYILSYKPKNKLPVEEYLKMQGRFAHMFKPGNEWMIEEVQKEVDKNWEELLKLCEL